MDRDDILSWLREQDPGRLQTLWERADRTRRRYVGDEVHLRGLVEISNFCRRECGYCGVHRSNGEIVRYRMTHEEVLQSAQTAARIGCNTVVLQAGEDPGLTTSFIEQLISVIKKETGLAITLSLGERAVAELERFRAAGADRYLLRFETSNAELLHRIHPPLTDGAPSRIDLLVELRRLGYEIGSGVMVGVPGTRFEDLARDIELFRELDLDMIGVGPYIAHPNTALRRSDFGALPTDPVPATPLMAYKTVALARLVCPQANIPATTALATADVAQGRRLGLQRGANVWMPNLTPVAYRWLYEIYPGKGGVACSPPSEELDVRSFVASLGRRVGAGRGDSPRYLARVMPVHPCSQG